MVWRGATAAFCEAQVPAVSVFLSDFISADISPQNKRSLMFQHRWVARSILIAGLVFGYSQQSLAETFTGEQFLAWKTGSQTFYMETSIAMVSIIVAQADQAKAKCVNDWHRRQIDNGYQGLRELMRKHPTYHPQGVILAWVQKACGPVFD